MFQVLSFHIDDQYFILGTSDEKLAWGVGRDVKSVTRLVRALIRAVFTPSTSYMQTPHCIALQNENAQLVCISAHLGRAAFCTASGKIGLLQLNSETPCFEVYDTLAGETLTTLVFHNEDAKLFVGTESGMVYRFDLQVLASALIFVP